MPFIRLYKFSPQTQPPTRIKHMFSWFNNEVDNTSAQPVDTIEVNQNDLIGGKEENRFFALKIFKGMKILNRVFDFFEKRR